MLKDQKSTREEEFKSAQTSVFDMVALPLRSSIHPACLCFILSASLLLLETKTKPKHPKSELDSSNFVLASPLQQNNVVDKYIVSTTIGILSSTEAGTGLHF